MKWNKNFAQLPGVVVPLGNNSTDNYTRLQAAITNATEGTLIILPAGTFNLSHGLTISKSISLVGEKSFTELTKGTVLKLDSGVNQDIITISANFVHIEDIGLDGNSSNNTSGSGIVATGLGHVFKNMMINAVYNSGITLVSNAHSLENIYIQNFGNANDDSGVSMSNCSNCSLVNVIVETSHHANTYGLHLKGAAITLNGFYCEALWCGIYIDVCSASSFVGLYTSCTNIDVLISANCYGNIIVASAAGTSAKAFYNSSPSFGIVQAYNFSGVYQRTSNSGSGTGNGAAQTIAHGLIAAPSLVSVTPTVTGATASWWADATNIYVTVTNLKTYNWYAQV